MTEEEIKNLLKEHDEKLIKRIAELYDLKPKQENKLIIVKDPKKLDDWGYRAICITPENQEKMESPYDSFYQNPYPDIVYERKTSLDPDQVWSRVVKNLDMARNFQENYFNLDKDTSEKLLFKTIDEAFSNTSDASEKQ
jgi:hypothetical protein